MYAFLALPLLSLILACGEKTEPDETGPEETDADTDTDTDTDTDSDADTDADPCAPTIPAAAKVVSSMDVANTAGGVWWVCPGGTLTLNGAQSQVYAEAGAFLTINGSQSQVWAKGNTMVTYNAADGTLVAEPSVNVVMNGFDVAKTECASITYSGGPTPGC